MQVHVGEPGGQCYRGQLMIEATSGAQKRAEAEVALNFLLDCCQAPETERATQDLARLHDGRHHVQQL